MYAKYEVIALVAGLLKLGCVTASDPTKRVMRSHVGRFADGKARNLD